MFKKLLGTMRQNCGYGHQGLGVTLRRIAFYPNRKSKAVV